ncbi:ankyrin repeat domain-containing protein 39-like, partial [Gigantopelta aegis]|uniref:ankyrin repeat domain-containing protein 39-like n=1 Tax=Gigantopelta aegis TaxID=1735272 RepID=UPI001B88C8C2
MRKRLRLRCERGRIREATKTIIEKVQQSYSMDFSISNGIPKRNGERYLTEAMIEERFHSLCADYPEIEIAKLKESHHHIHGCFFAITADKAHENNVLIEFAKNGDLSGVKEILVRGTNINYTDESGWAALHYASFNGHTDIVEVLVNHNADINVVTTSGSTAVMLAAENRHHDVVLILTQKGANLDLVNKSGWAALHYASYKGHTDIVEVLVNHNADINVVTT